MHKDGIMMTTGVHAHTWNIIPAKCHSMKTLTQDRPTANKATFTQYGVIILDSLLKDDLSELAVYKPRGLRAISQLAKTKGKITLLSVMKYQLIITLATVCKEEITTCLKKETGENHTDRH